MYTPPPDEKVLAGIGLTLDDYDNTVEIWPENLRVLEIFRRVGTQWRAGGTGVIGLDHDRVDREIGKLKLAEEESDALMDDVRVMEIEALNVMSEKHE